MASMFLDPYEEWKALGRPGGSMQAWQGQQAAPVAPVAPPPGPGQFSQAWMDEGLAAYNAGQRGSDPLRTPGFDPNTFRQQYAAAQGGNRPEDLARFSDATLAGWMPFYDPSTGKYRSMRGAEGWFDKPTECPPGFSPSGPSETDPCVPNAPGQPAPQAPAPVAAPAPSPLTSMLAGQGMAAPQTAAPLASAAKAAPFGPSVNQTTPWFGKAQPLAQTMAGLQGQPQNLLGGTGTGSVGRLPGSGWQTSQSPLLDVMARRQKRFGGVGRWF